MNTPRQGGMSLIELMVALTISAVLVAGAAQVYIDSRATYAQNETVSRLQETARYALSVIETDARMANYWGLIQNSPPISGAAVTQGLPWATVANTAAANVCGNNFATDVTTPIQGDNNSYQLSSDNSRAGGCDTLSGWTTSPVNSADTLTVRHASVANQAAGTNGTLQICSTQSSAALMNNGNCVGGALPPAVQINNVIVHAYYVDRNSQQQAGLPSLRRKSLTTVGGAIAWQDEEVIAGVEDMQIEFGIDPNQTGTATRYVLPNDPALTGATAQVVAIRVWLMVRSDTPEMGFTDGRPYSYADRVNGAAYDLSAAASAGRSFVPSGDPNKSLTGLMSYRRILVSRTIQLRNTYRT